MDFLPLTPVSGLQCKTRLMNSNSTMKIGRCLKEGLQLLVLCSREIDAALQRQEKPVILRRVNGHSLTNKSENGWKRLRGPGARADEAELMNSQASRGVSCSSASLRRARSASSAQEPGFERPRAAHSLPHAGDDGIRKPLDAVRRKSTAKTASFWTP